MQKLKINDDHKMHKINTSDKMCKINMSKNAQVGGLFLIVCVHLMHNGYKPLKIEL
jgi:hypothetical protein